MNIDRILTELTEKKKKNLKNGGKIGQNTQHGSRPHFQALPKTKTQRGKVGENKGRDKRKEKRQEKKIGKGQRKKGQISAYVF